VISYAILGYSCLFTLLGHNYVVVGESVNVTLPFWVLLLWIEDIISFPMHPSMYFSSEYVICYAIS
jgi:hypothetical protein